MVSLDNTDDDDAAMLNGINFRQNIVLNRFDVYVCGRLLRRNRLDSVRDSLTEEEGQVRYPKRIMYHSEWIIYMLRRIRVKPSHNIQTYRPKWYKRYVSKKYPMLLLDSVPLSLFVIRIIILNHEWWGIPRRVSFHNKFSIFDGIFFPRKRQRTNEFVEIIRKLLFFISTYYERNFWKTSIRLWN